MGYWLPTIGLLGMVIGMYVLSNIAKRKLGVGAGTVSGDSLKIVGKRVLEPRKSLYVVSIGERYVLVGTAEQSVSLIDHITAEEFASMSETPAKAAKADEVKLDELGLTIDADHTPADGAHAGTPQFASVAESFSLLLDKAKNRKTRQELVGSATDGD